MTDRCVSSGQHEGESFLVYVSAELAGLVRSVLCEMFTERVKISLSFSCAQPGESPPPHILPSAHVETPLGVMDSYIEEAFRTDQPINYRTHKGP